MAVKKINGDPHLNEPGIMQSFSEFLFGKEKTQQQNKMRGSGNKNDIESRRTGRKRKGAPNIDITPTIQSIIPFAKNHSLPFAKNKIREKQMRAENHNRIPKQSCS